MKIYDEFKEIYCGYDEIEEVAKYIEGKVEGWTITLFKPCITKEVEEMFKLAIIEAMTKSPWDKIKRKLLSLFSVL